MARSETHDPSTRIAADRIRRDERRRRRQVEDIARLIRTHRSERKLSQQQLGDRARTSHSAISRIESGSHGITVDTLQRIAQALGVNLVITFESGGRKRVRRSVRLYWP